jgi:hypothetical protein
MKAKCIENECNNTNFTIGKTYELSEKWIRTDCSGMCCHFKDYNKPKSFNIGSTFYFGMCKFKIVSHRLKF